MIRRTCRAAAAAGALALLLAGVPLALALLVGNPWPGRTRLAIGDDVAVVVGVLTVVAWLVWARLVAAVVVEVREQLGERTRLAAVPAGSRVRLTPPATATGTAWLAQRLVAAALVVLPVGARPSPSAFAEAALPAPTRPVASAVAAPAAGWAAAATTTAPTPPRSPERGAVTVTSGDTLIGIARAHLGDAGRWREIFELNRDRAQPDGGRLTSPSTIRVGWRLLLPGGGGAAPSTAAPPSAGGQPPAGAHLPAAEVTVAPGDNLWDLSRARLAAAGLPHDDVAVADHVDAVVRPDGGALRDPDVILVGERLRFPAVGTPVVADVPVTAPAVPAGGTEVPAAVAEVPAAAAADPPAAAAIVDPPAARAAPTVPPTTVPPTTAPTAATTTAPPTTVRTAPVVPPGGAPAGRPLPEAPGSPAPIGIGEAALLSAGVLALVASRRRTRLRASEPRARVPEPAPEVVDAERRLRAVDAGERLLRVDIATRAAAAVLVQGTAEIALVRVDADGSTELTLTGPATLPAPWTGGGATWSLPGSTPIELLAEAARSVGAPCVALAQLGAGADGREVLADLEALGLLAVDAPSDVADAVVRGVAATLACSVFAEVASLVGAGVDERALLQHRHAHVEATVDGALELAATLVGAPPAGRRSTFALRARHTSGEAWEPAVVLVGSSLVDEVTADVVRSTLDGRGGIAVVAAGAVPGAPWTLRAEQDRWVLEPAGIELVPVGLSTDDVDALHAVVAAADAPLVPATEPSTVAPGGAGVIERHAVEPDVEPDVVELPWSLLVRLLGPVDIVARCGAVALFERSKALELVAWLTMHRDRATRTGARTALWELDVRDATFANVVSEARRAMARLVDPPAGEEWLGRTLTEQLPLHDGVVADVDLVRRRLDLARRQAPAQAIETLRPAVELVRDMPFAGTGYLWPDAEGITSNLVLVATSAAAELAAHLLSVGDVDGVFWATDRGLRVLPGHEELIALRMRAHAGAGDLAGVRHEWETYERVLNADPWTDGEPAAKLVQLRRQLLSP